MAADRTTDQGDPQIAFFHGGEACQESYQRVALPLEEAKA